MTSRRASAAPTVEFDHHSPEYARNWRGILADVRSRCPVAHSSAHGGFTLLTRYADVEQAIKDNVTFSSRHSVEPGSIFGGVVIPSSPRVTVPIEMDPPEYTSYRKVLNPWFSPARSASYEPFIRSATTALLDEVIERGEADLVHDLASPVPALLTARLLGVPLTDWRIYSDAAHETVTYPPGSPELIEAHRKLREVEERCRKIAHERRAEPQDDLISVFVTMEVDGERLEDERVLQMCTLVIFGGNDTTTSLLANALAWLSEHPEQREWLAADLSRIKVACEEFLRYFTPTQTQSRTVTKPTEIGGCPLERGDRVLLSLAGANLDPEAFDHAGEVVLDRWPNRHQSFGLGLHRCLGSNLARMEFRVIVEEVLKRMPDFTVDFDRAQRYRTIGDVHGWVNMPAAFTPGTRVGSDFRL